MILRDEGGFEIIQKRVVWIAELGVDDGTELGHWQITTASYRMNSERAAEQCLESFGCVKNQYGGWKSPQSYGLARICREEELI